MSTGEGSVVINGTRVPVVHLRYMAPLSVAQTVGLTVAELAAWARGPGAHLKLGPMGEDKPEPDNGAFGEHDDDWPPPEPKD